MIDSKIEAMASGVTSSCGTGGMITKFHAAKIATAVFICFFKKSAPF